ncbi:MAG TPA: SigE family RNA polymerase sigma factor [Acidimicrobiales bacterium]
MTATATTASAAPRPASPSSSPWTEAFTALYRQQYAPMVRLAFLLVGTDSVAEELVQDAFLRVRDPIEAVDRPVAYLRRAVVNACRNHHRHQAVERRGAARLAGGDSAEPELDHLADALARLPDRQRAVLVLRYYLGCSEVEIADALGCRPGTVKSLASRGLAALREVLE